MPADIGAALPRRWHCSQDLHLRSQFWHWLSSTIWGGEAFDWVSELIWCAYHLTPAQSAWSFPFTRLWSSYYSKLWKTQSIAPSSSLSLPYVRPKASSSCCYWTSILVIYDRMMNERPQTSVALRESHSYSQGSLRYFRWSRVTGKGQSYLEWLQLLYSLHQLSAGSWFNHIISEEG